MDKLVDRLGLYDLWAVLFPGTMISIGTTLFIEVLYSIMYKKQFTEKSLSGSILTWIIFVVLSIFLGIVLQEIGRGIRVVFGFRNASFGILNPTAGIFTKNEIASFKAFFIENGWDGRNVKVGNKVFHIINAEAQECGVANRYVKLNVMQNMSFNIAAAMLIGCMEALVIVVVSIIKQGIFPALIAGIFAIICLMLLLVFIGRGKRFNRYWVRNIIYAMAVRNRMAEKIDN